MFVNQFYRMKIKGKFPLFVVVALAWVVIVSSCANIGMPEGGPTDSIPPVLLNAKPAYKALNYGGDDVSFTFNEYLNTDDISSTLVVSPPLKKKPTVLTKSKTLLVRFNEELKDSVTYSLDFKNSITDNNEQNPYSNFRFSFSTGSVYDSLRVAGRVIKAFNLDPDENGTLVVLHANLHDSAVYRCIPDYIAETDENGLFMIDNIAPGTYNLFAFNDLNNDLMYNEGAEEIAFVDSVVVPKAHFVAEPDTLVTGVDSMLIMGHTYFSPEPFYMRYFTEDIYEQYFKTQTRDKRNSCIFSFNEPVDSFSVKLLDTIADDWQLFEFDDDRDSMLMWITDTTISKKDSLNMEVSYCMLDTAGNPYVKRDTVLMSFSEQAESGKKKKKKQGGGLFGGKDHNHGEKHGRPSPEGMEEGVTDSVPKIVIPQFDWQSDLGSTMELNGEIRFTSPEPIKNFDETMCALYLTEDTLKTPLKINVEEDDEAYRTYLISYKWEPGTAYCFDIDSAACENIYGITSRKLHKEFKARQEDYYGSIEFEFTNVSSPIIIQVLKNDDNEAVVREKQLSANGDVHFKYLTPEKYKVKVIFDDNGNGKWDCGSFHDKIQPERVAYVQEIIKLRPNWNEKYSWNLKPDPVFRKKIIDKEVEEQKRQEAEEKARKEKEAQQKTSPFKKGSSEE